MSKNKLESIRYIKIPKELERELGSFKLDTNILLPIHVGSKELSDKDITVENIVTGVLTVIAYEKDNKNFEYYKDFILKLDPELPAKLNTAAIAKEQKKEYEFAEELFLAVYHLLPQPASCINLATLYSYMSVSAREKNQEDEEDKYLKKAKDTLLDGLQQFKEDENLLAELSSFEAYMGNLEEALTYLERFLKIAKESDKKEELKKVKEQIEFQLKYDNEIKEAYDFIMLGLPEKALPVIDSFIKANPKVWNGHFLKGWALRSAKHYEEAEKELLECLKLGESNSEIYNELSICELEKGNRELALAYLETAEDLDPNSLSIKSNLAFMYLTEGKFDEARSALEKARYISQNDELIKELINQYEAITGDKIGEIIHEEIIESEEEEEDAYQEELEAINDNSDSESSYSSCSHNHNDEHGCCHHHSDDHECCHHEHNHECSHHHHHDNEHECCHHNHTDGHKCCHHHDED